MATREMGKRNLFIAIGGLILCVAIYGIVQSLTYPLLSLRLEQQEYKGWMIGLNAAMMPFGMLIAGSFAPNMVSRFGLYSLMQLGLLAVSVCLFGIYWSDEYFVWILLRFVSGIILTLIFVASDSAINELVDNRYRGRVIGLYSMALSLGFVLGPSVLTVFGSDSATPFIFLIVLPILALVPLGLAKTEIMSVESRNERTSMWGFFFKIPVLMMAVIFVSFADQGALSLLPIYGLSIGLEERAANFLVVMMTLGSFLFMYPIGWVADRVNRMKLMLFCSVVSSIASFFFIFLAEVSPIALSVMIFVWGGTYYAIYSLTLVRVGQLFTRSKLVGATAACGAAWGIGGIIGTPMLGASMDLGGTAGLPIMLTTLFVILSIGIWMAISQSEHEVSEDEVEVKND